MTRELSDRRARLEDEAVIARVAAFSTSAPAQDVVRFASQQDVALILVDGTASLTSGASIVSRLAAADCDVVVSYPSNETPTGRGLLVPFGGGEHDWAALELAAHLARLLDDPRSGGRDLREGRTQAELAWPRSSFSGRSA
jgi:hypothetical protein